MTPSTEALTTSAVTMVVVRAAGEVNTDLTADNLLRTRMVTIQLDGVLCRISESLTATHVRKHWMGAGLGAAKLPSQVEPTLIEANRDISPVGVVAKLVGYPAITATVMPRRDSRTPPYLRIQVGPIVWQILDQAAYESMSKVWRGAERLLRWQY